MRLLQNFQVIKQNIHFEGVPEKVCKKKRMRLHELSHLPERNSQSTFSTKGKKKEAKKENQIQIKIPKK